MLTTYLSQNTDRIVNLKIDPIIDHESKPPKYPDILLDFKIYIKPES
jgi:hypothetical protein